MDIIEIIKHEIIKQDYQQFPNNQSYRPLAKKIYAMIINFHFQTPVSTHNYQWLTTNYNKDHNGDDDSDNDSIRFGKF